MNLLNHWTVIAPVIGTIIVAFLVNRFAPEHRKHVRRVVILVGFLLVVTALKYGASAFGFPVWAERLQLAAELLSLFSLINVATTLLFDLALPAIGINLATIVSDLIIGLFYIIATISTLRRGLDFQSVVTTSAVATGVIAISLQATLGNILGGVALQLDGSIRAGDWIQLENGKQGRVREVRWRHTVVETRDWDTIVVPNASLLASNITILGKRNGEVVPHRMWVYFNVDFRFAPTRVIQVVTDALAGAQIPNVATDPKPNVVCMDFAKDNRESYAVYAVRYWLTDLAVDDPTNSAVRARVFAALRRAQIPLARPANSTFITLDDDDAQARRAARHRNMRIAALKAVPLFAPLTEKERVALSDSLQYSPFTSGETITRQGAIAHWLYMIISGTAEIRISVDGASPMVVATVNAPDVFGEMGLMTGEPRLADVVATSDVECFKLEKSGFQEILVARPEIAKEFSEVLAKRRVELVAVREGLDQAAMHARQESEQARILARIQDFFGLSG